MVWDIGGSYCQEHAPLVLQAVDFDMIFAKAGVIGPKRHQPFDPHFFSTAQHHRRAKRL